MLCSRALRSQYSVRAVLINDLKELCLRSRELTPAEGSPPDQLELPSLERQIVCTKKVEVPPPGLRRNERTACKTSCCERVGGYLIFPLKAEGVGITLGRMTISVYRLKLLLSGTYIGTID
jgi:hypothetical protein